jgi:peptidoglycan/xylan/chitin deacetylase (PgdA/CDA1 family)
VKTRWAGSSSIRASGRRWLVDGYSIAVTSAAIDRRRLRRLARRRGLIVFNLHNVAPPGPRFVRPIPPRAFDELVAWLKHECQLTTFAGLAELAPDQERPAAILSFDDGYRDFVEYAMPILERHGVQVNQNVIAACVEDGRPPWNVELLAAMEHVPVEGLRALQLPCGKLPRLESGGEAALMRWGVQVSRLLKLRSRAEREPLVATLIDQLDGGAELPTEPMMTARDLVEVARHHEVGMHSYEHDSMEFESDEFFAEDVHRCRSWYRERLGGEPRIYAFSNGSHRPSQLEIARRSGFEHLLLVGERPSMLGAHIHPRITADGVTLRELRMRIARAG